jgi:hypothetical protein
VNIGQDAILRQLLAGSLLLEGHDLLGENDSVAADAIRDRLDRPCRMADARTRQRHREFLVRLAQLMSEYTTP